MDDVFSQAGHNSRMQTAEEGVGICKKVKWANKAL